MTESPLINVSPNDLIIGTISGNCRSGALSCLTWTIFYSLDLSNGESTTLNHTPSQGQIFNWAFGGVMEPYYVVQCSDYPPNHHLSFDVHLQQELTAGHRPPMVRRREYHRDAAVQLWRASGTV